MLLWYTTAASLLLSLLAKALADAYLHERIAILGEFAGLLPVDNPGIAFGIRMPPVLLFVAIGTALTLVCVLAVQSAKTPLQRIGFGLIIGGALGNILDRLRDGVVTDFFQVGSFPVFNVADSCITVGVALLLWSTMKKHQASSLS